MKLIARKGYKHYEEVTPVEAVQSFTGSNAALNGLIGRLVGVLMDKKLLTAHEVSELFDFEVVAEDD